MEVTPGQVGSPGAHSGIGKWAVADCWLGMALVVDDEMEAAAAPAKTTDKAMMRMASFMVGNLLRFGFVGDESPYTFRG